MHVKVNKIVKRHYYRNIKPEGKNDTVGGGVRRDLVCVWYPRDERTGNERVIGIPGRDFELR